MSQKVKAIVFLIFFCIFAYFCWYAYFVQVDHTNENEIPILKAQADIKSKPEDPGGIDVLNKDKVIYEHMLGKKKIESKVKVVENSEKPVARENLEGLIDKQLKNAGIVSKKRPEPEPQAENIQSVATPQELDKKTEEDKKSNDVAVETKQVEAPKKGEATPPKTEAKKEEEKMSLSINGVEIGSKPVENPKKLDYTPQIDKNTNAKTSEPKKTETIEEIEAKPKILIEKYTIRVAKLKDKKFVSKGIEIFQTKYSILNKYNGRLVQKDGDYFLHFSSINSKQEAEKICKTIAEGGSKCLVFPE